MLYGHLKLITFFVWISGVVLYIIGYNEHGCEWNWLALALRASLSSIEMFVSHSDLLEVGQKWHHNSLYMTIFSIVHFMAVLTSAIFIIHMFDLKLKSWLRKLWWQFRPKKTLYVFWGINNASMLLAEQILNSIGKKMGEVGIIFVYDKKRSHTASEEFGLRYSFSHLMSHALLSDSNEEWVIDYLGGIIAPFHRKTLKKLSCGEIKFMFLSDSEKENVDNYKRVCRENSIEKNLCTYYCHAARTVENKALIKLRPQKNDSKELESDLHLIDSSYLSILELKQDESAHPVNYVKIQKGGIVEDSFNALVLGFGETGKEALAFLYEFSAFLGGNNERSPYKLLAIDKGMDKIKGGYYAQRPALLGNENIVLQTADINSKPYWEYIDAIVKEGLNYIVISLGDDELNIRTALSLYEYVMRFAVKNGELLQYNSGRLVMYVRVHNDCYDYLLDGIYDKNVIRFFGKNNSVFTNKVIFNDIHKQNAVRFERNYNKIKDQYKENDDRIKDYKDKREKEKIEELRKKERTDSQNLANSYHCATKIKLLKEGISEDEQSAFFERLSLMTRCPKNVIDYKGEYWYEDSYGHKLEDETILMTNLAKCEHLRWNASIEMLGYETNKDDSFSCNELTMKHNCLTSWDGLHQIWLDLKDKKQYSEYKQYDFNVVETSIKLYIEGKGQVL